MPLLDSAVRRPVPDTMSARALPEAQPGRFTISWMIRDRSGVRWLMPWTCTVGHDRGCQLTDALVGAESSGTTTAEEAIELPDQPGTRYVRYVGHGNTAATNSTWNSLNEMSLFAVP